MARRVKFSLVFFLLIVCVFLYENGSKAQESDLYLSSPLECSRTCREGEPPKICYYNFVVELYTVLGDGCLVCTPNATNQLVPSCQCILADGVEKGLLSVNRMLPGPTIEVCAGDEVVIDVDNEMNGIETSLHWHGIWQNGTPTADGVPYVSQCPISDMSIFRYQWSTKPENSGTHFWHSHAGIQKLDGLSGILIVRRPKSQEPNNHLYDHDLTSHIMFITDWMHTYSFEVLPGHRLFNIGQAPDNILINGKGQYTNRYTGTTTDTPLAVFEVTRGQRYRFRMINAFCSSCVPIFTIEDHPLTIIASDGQPTEPTVVDTIISMTGERFDFILNANQTRDLYWIQIRALGSCVTKETNQLGILRYVDAVSNEPETPRPTYNNTLSEGLVFGPLDGICDTVRTDAICMNQIKNGTPIHQELLKETPDVKMYMSFSFHIYELPELFQPNEYRHYFAAINRQLVEGLMDGISHVFPSSPTISQMNDIPPERFCNKSHQPANCIDSINCTCTHMINIPLNAVVEIVLVDSVLVDLPLQHPFHLHGFVFAVLDLQTPPGPQNPLTVDYVKKMDEEGKIRRNLVSPPLKDTLTIPQHGYAVIRFRADNPGSWLFHCHVLFHNELGMAVILNVGDKEEQPPIPQNFPKCGNYKPNIRPPPKAASKNEDVKEKTTHCKH